jgi:hypothetical protein
MDEELLVVARRHAAERGLRLRRRLGGGIHGIVFEAEDQRNPGRLAVKFLAEPDAFAREVAVYRRLAERVVVSIFGFNVPQLLRAYEASPAVEMTMVARPFVLDFAAAYLRRPPQFPAEVMAQWEEEKRELFGDRWPVVPTILAKLREHGIHQTDVTPGNIGFEEG